MKLKIGSEIIEAVENDEWDKALAKIECMMKYESDPERLDKLNLLYEAIKLCKSLDS